MFAHPEIKYRPKQEAAYIEYCNPDGKVCHHQERCDVYREDGSTLATEEIERVSAILHLFYLENHHSENAPSEGDPVEAASEGDHGEDGEDGEGNEDGEGVVDPSVDQD